MQPQQQHRHIPINSALGRLRQPGLHGRFKDSLGYIMISRKEREREKGGSYREAERQADRQTQGLLVARRKERYGGKGRDEEKE